MRETEKNLAIVIPAYKHQFLRETLESIAGQTCKDFNLYIGDDGSPNPISEIVDEFRGRLDFVYKRFEENLGAKSLVGHWNRCIEMTKGEEWIWLFSDDDKLGENCVKEFYRTIDKNWDLSLIRFNKVIFSKEKSVLLKITNKEKVTPFEVFIYDALGFTGKPLTMPEFVFPRKIYEEFGIPDFPLAWGSDRAAFLEFAYNLKNVKNIQENVYFNQSHHNISSINDNLEIIKQKRRARNQFYSWLARFLKKVKISNQDIDIKLLARMYVDKQVYTVLSGDPSICTKPFCFVGLFRFAWTMPILKTIIKGFLQYNFQRNSSNFKN